MKCNTIKIFCLRKVVDKRIINKRQRIPKGNQKWNNPEKLATQSTQDEDKHNCVVTIFCTMSRQSCLSIMTNRLCPSRSDTVSRQLSKHHD